MLSDLGLCAQRFVRGGGPVAAAIRGEVLLQEGDLVGDDRLVLGSVEVVDAGIGDQVGVGARRAARIAGPAR